MSAAPPRSPFAGIFPVLCTPFDARGALDLESLDRLVDFTLASGADGLTLGGVASEVMKLADEERRAIVERVLARAAGRAPVWVGSGHQCTELALEHSLHARRHGAAGVMVMPPHVQKPSLAALAGFFRELDAGLELPIMIQDAPNLSGLHLPADWILDVAARCRNVRAVKVEAPPTGPKIGELAARGDRRLALFGGLSGANLVSELRRGAAGTLPGSAFPELYVRILAAHRAGDRAAADELQRRAAPLVRFVSQSIEWSYHAYKHVLVRRGVLAAAHVRRPTTSFDGRDREELDALWAELALEG